MIKVRNIESYRQMCDKCQTELEYELSDAYVGALGARYIKCPVCGNEVILNDFSGLRLTSNNIEFPKHFFEPGGVNIDDDQIQEWVRKCLKIAEGSEEPYGYFTLTGSGNTIVILVAYEDEYVIYVSKDYYSTSVSR